MRDIMYKVSLESNKALQEKLVELKMMKKVGFGTGPESEGKNRDLLNEIAGKFND
jgi:hypothetical protein